LPALRETGGQIARSEAVVLHSGYDTSPEGQARKRERDLKLLALDLEERPDHPFVLFNYGMTFHYLEDHPAAVEWLQKCLIHSPATDSHVRKAYALLFLSHRMGGDLEGAERVLEKGLALFPDDPELNFHAGHFWTSKREWDRAKAHYLKTLEGSGHDYFSSIDRGITGYKTFHNLAGVFSLEGNYPEAKRHWLQAMETASEFLPSALELFHASLEAGDLATSRQALDHLRQKSGESEEWATLGVRYAETVGGEENGVEFLKGAISRSPQKVGPRLLYARELLKCGEEGEATPHLMTLQGLGVAEAAYFLGIIGIRRGEYETALGWMERALVLNPEHEETREQIVNLKRAMGNAKPPLTKAVSLERACAQVAETFRLDPQELLAYAQEDEVGGYASPGTETASPLWIGGSVWEGEGKLLYALVRALRPKVIVEIGSRQGCSASHLASACLKNGGGTVYAVDPALDFSGIDPKLETHLVPVEQDFFTWELPEKIDFVFEDGAHTPGFTREALKRLKPHLTLGAAVLCHDFYGAAYGAQIAEEFRGEMGASAAGVLIAPSDCGLGYARFEA